jgi:uncharacterized membrane protein YraQ (UPF0718 family)
MPEHGVANMNFLLVPFSEAWKLLQEASVYVIFGLIVSGLLRAFLNPNIVANHLGDGRIRSVLKAAFLGIPVPL